MLNLNYFSVVFLCKYKNMLKKDKIIEMKIFLDLSPTEAFLIWTDMHLNNN